MEAIPSAETSGADRGVRLHLFHHQTVAKPGYPVSMVFCSQDKLYGSQTRHARPGRARYCACRKSKKTI